MFSTKSKAQFQLKILAGGMLAMLCTACAGAGGSLVASPPATAPVAEFAGLPAIPAEQSITRDPAALEQTTQHGADASRFSAGAAIAGTELTVAAAADAVEYAVYSFFAGTDVLTGVQADISVDSGDQVWIGIANYGPRKWEFKGPYPAAGAVQFDNLDAGIYLSPDGYCHFLVLTYSATTATVATVEFTTDDALPSFSLSGNITDDLDEVALAGVTLTLEPGGATEITDEAGDYFFATVEAGEYTLTPTLAGYTFSPPAYNLNLQGLATDVDFTGVPGA